MTARDDDLRSAQSIFNRDDISAEAIANIVILNHDAFALRHHRFKFSKVENYIGAIEPAHRAADNLARTILEFLVDHFLLDLTNALHHRLLGGLRGDASEILWCDFNFDRVADFHPRFESLRAGERDFILRITDVLDDHETCERADVPGLRVDVDPHIARGADAFLRRREQRSGHRLEQDFAFDPALPLQVIEHGDKFGIHKKHAARRLKKVGHQFPLRSARGLDL